MDQTGREDPKLREVKAVLHRLQGLPAEAQPADFRGAGPNPRRGLWFGITGIVTVAAVVVLVLAFAFPNMRQLATSTPKGAPETAGPKDAQAAGPDGGSVAKAGAATDAAKAPAIKAALEGAATLMNSGRVQAARRRLLAVAPDSSPDVLWALARSYDPNVLGQLPAADAPPDVAEATRWYRAWYAAAVRQGLVADSVSLERIIGSMQRP
jgi:hypothetical protein